MCPAGADTGWRWSSADRGHAAQILRRLARSARSRLPPGGIERQDDRDTDDDSPETCRRESSETLPRTPRNAPTIAIILTSPIPMPSRPAHRFVQRCRSPKEQAAERGAEHGVDQTQHIRRTAVHEPTESSLSQYAVPSSGGTSVEKNRPAASPGQFTRSGSSRTRRSVIVKNDDQASEEQPLHGHLGRAQTRDSTLRTSSPVSNSTSGYIGEIGIAARPAFSAQPDPGKHWHIVIGLDRRLAPRAPRAGRHDGHPFRNPRDADIQEAANNDAEKKKEGDDHISNVPQDAQVPQRTPAAACRMPNRWLGPRAPARGE